MLLALLVLLGAGIWAFMLLLAISLCKAAKAGDKALEASYAAAQEASRQEVMNSPQVRGRIAHDAGRFDLGAHPRSTRRAYYPTPPEHPTEPAAGDPGGAGPRQQSLPLSEAPREPGGRSACTPITTAAMPTAGGVLTTDAPPTAKRLLSLREAAEVLGVSPDVLLAWEARYGYPKPYRASTTRGLRYSRAELLVLADSLQNGLSIPSAIDDARSSASDFAMDVGP